MVVCGVSWGLVFLVRVYIVKIVVKDFVMLGLKSFQRQSLGSFQAVFAGEFLGVGV